MSGKTADDRGRRLGNGSKLHAGFSQRDARADIRKRPQLDRLDQALEHMVEQFDLLAVEAPGGCQEKIRYALDRFQVLFRGADIYRCFNFVDDRPLGIWHRSS